VMADHDLKAAMRLDAVRRRTLLSRVSWRLNAFTHIPSHTRIQYRLPE
jgi:hypothetical protein